MGNSVKNILLGVIIGTFISSCAQNKKHLPDNNPINDPNIATSPIDVQAEIDAWKQELISSKTLGKPCNNDNYDRNKMNEWAVDNPEQLNGFPSDPKKIGNGKEDFDGDGKQDVIMFFNSENCTGHNGGTPSFAKIIYSNGNSKSNIQDDILKAILSTYKKQRISDKDLMEVTDNYLKSTLTIGFQDGKIQGQFQLYTSKDAHCCPSYNGKYIYNPNTDEAKIEVTKT